MSNRTLPLTDTLYDYLITESLRESPLLRRLREETATLEQSNMQIAPEQGQFMALLVTLMGARRALEIGTYTGYSSLCVAQALPADGELMACDLSETWTRVARRYWEEAGVADRITLRLGPALDTLDDLLAQGGADRLDFAFIDAHKPEYIDYYERTLALIRPGGLIAVDNVLWAGRVANPSDVDEDTRAIRSFNTHLRHDPRVDISLVPIGDGLTLARKR